MFYWLKNQLLRREIARLREKSKRLSEEIERATGEPFRLTPEEMQSLAEKSKGIDSERLKQISTLHPDDVTKLIDAVDSASHQ